MDVKYGHKFGSAILNLVLQIHYICYQQSDICKHYSLWNADYYKFAMSLCRTKWEKADKSKGNTWPPQDSKKGMSSTVFILDDLCC